MVDRSDKGGVGSHPVLESDFETGVEFLSRYWDFSGPGSFCHEIKPGRQLPPEAYPGTLFSVRLRLLDRGAEFLAVDAWRSVGRGHRG